MMDSVVHTSPGGVSTWGLSQQTQLWVPTGHPTSPGAVSDHSLTTTIVSTPNVLIVLCMATKVSAWQPI